MTPKKNIVRRQARTLPDGSPIPKMGKEFNEKENAFIYWYTYAGSEAFMNAGRAGYKPGNAVVYGYQLRKKPEIAKTIDEVLGHAKEGMKSLIYRIAFLCRDRMFFDITDFYRQVKKPLKNPEKIKLPNGNYEDITWEYSFEAIPLDEISERNRMCIDGIDFRGPHSIPVYKLPDRGKAFWLFMKCYKILMPEMNGAEMNLKATAEIIRVAFDSHVITLDAGT